MELISFRRYREQVLTPEGKAPGCHLWPILGAVRELVVATAPQEPSALSCRPSAQNIFFPISNLIAMYERSDFRCESGAGLREKRFGFARAASTRNANLRMRLFSFNQISNSFLTQRYFQNLFRPPYNVIHLGYKREHFFIKVFLCATAHRI